MKTDKMIWGDKRPKLDEAYQSWLAFSKNQVGKVKFEETLEIHRIGFSDNDHQKVSPIGAYGVSTDGRFLGQSKGQRLWPMYRQVLDKEYFFKKHDWWMHTADATILLTTEALP